MEARRRHKEKRGWEAQSASSRERRKTRSSKSPWAGPMAETSVGLLIGGRTQKKKKRTDQGLRASMVHSREVEDRDEHEPRDRDRGSEVDEVKRERTRRGEDEREEGKEESRGSEREVHRDENWENWE